MRLEPKQETLDLVWPFEFFREGSAAMARNVSAALTLACEPVTAATVGRLLESLPDSQEALTDDAWRRVSFFYDCLRRAHDRDAQRADALIRYFCVWFRRNRDARHMLVAGVMGVVEGMEAMAKG